MPWKQFGLPIGLEEKKPKLTCFLAFSWRFDLQKSAGEAVHGTSFHFHVFLFLYPTDSYSTLVLFYLWGTFLPCLSTECSRQLIRGKATVQNAPCHGKQSIYLFIEATNILTAQNGNMRLANDRNTRPFKKIKTQRRKSNKGGLSENMLSKK